MVNAQVLTLIASAYLLGLGLTVGLVVYPAFALVDDEQWPSYHQQHSSRIAWAVGLGWIAQATGLLWWIVSGPHSAALVVAGIFSLYAVLLTAIRAVPIHAKLAARRTNAKLRQLRIVHASRNLCWAITTVAACLAVK